jgi:hypothetical protein
MIMTIATANTTPMTARSHHVSQLSRLNPYSAIARVKPDSLESCSQSAVREAGRTAAKARRIVEREEKRMSARV